MTNKITYYHLTRVRNIPSIMQKGLKPSSGPGGFSESIHREGVFLWKSPQEIVQSGLFVDEPGWTLLRVDLPYSFPVDRHAEPYEGEYSYISRKTIPPKYITNLGNPREFVAGLTAESPTLSNEI